MIFTLQINPSLVRFVNQLKSEQWLASVEPTENNRKELVEWIHANTSPTDLFAIAPAMDGFRLWEERPIVVDLKNVPFRAAELKGWSERINSAYTINLLTPFQVPPPPQTDPTAEQMISYATSYGARFVILREPFESHKTVFQSVKYTVLDLNLLKAK